MTKEEKLKAIYKEMANKELTFGCKVYVVDASWIVVGCDKDWVNVRWENLGTTLKKNNPDITVVWHQVMIWDVLEWLEYKMPIKLKDVMDLTVFFQTSYITTTKLINIWKKKSEPIDNQPDYCIDYVMELIEKFW